MPRLGDLWPRSCEDAAVWASPAGESTSKTTHVDLEMPSPAPEPRRGDVVCTRAIAGAASST